MRKWSTFKLCAELFVVSFIIHLTSTGFGVIAPISFWYWSFVSSFFHCQYCYKLSVLLIVLKNQISVSLIFSTVFLLTISLIFDFMFSISFLLFALRILYSFFSPSLRWELRLLIWDISFFLMYIISAINFHLSTALATSYNFDILYFNFHSFQCIVDPWTIWIWTVWSLSYIYIYMMDVI